MKRKGRLENQVQSGVISYLCFRPDIFWWRNNSGAYKPASGGYIKYGMVGSADILALQAPHGRFIGVETKREVGGELTVDQRVWGENVVAHGGLYVVATTVQDVIDALGEPQVRVVKQVARQRTYPRGNPK